MSIIDLNREALQTYHADDKQALIRKIEGPLTDEQRQSLKQTLLTFADGNRRASVRGLSQRADGAMFPIIRNTELISSEKYHLMRITVSISQDDENSYEIQTYRFLNED